MKSKLVIATFSSGSTYLQRSATVWLRTLHDPRTVNPHELLNGIGHHPDGYLIKQWMDVNAQSTAEIQRLLENNITPVVARLSYDHLLLRKDDPEQLQKFYKFLNDYFDIYVSRRDNLFDYGLCWAIRRCTDREPAFQINNVHTPEDRIKLYGQRTFRVDPTLILGQAEKYLEYLKWVDVNFPTAQPVHYRDLEINIDSVLQQLFPASKNMADCFGLTIAQYTRIAYNISNGNIKHYTPEIIALWEKMKKYLDELCEQQVLLDSIPIKSTNMQDKLTKVSNMDECLESYNNWAKTCLHDAPTISAQELWTMADADRQLYS